MGRISRAFKHVAVRDNTPDDRLLQIENGRQKGGDASITGRIISPLSAGMETINL